MVELDGRLDNVGLRQVETALLQSLENRQGAILVDMANVDYMSSTGIRLLAYFMMLSKELNRDFRLYNLSPNVERAINIVRMGDFFKAYPTYQAALATL